MSLPRSRDISLLTPPGTIDQTVEGQQLTSPVEDVQQSTEQPVLPLLKDNALEGGREGPAGAVKEYDTIHPGE